MNYSTTNIKNNQSFFAKVEIVRILLFHFLVDFLPKIEQSPEKVSFPTHTQKTLQTILRKESQKPRPRGKFAKVKIKIKKRTQTL